MSDEIIVCIVGLLLLIVRELFLGFLAWYKRFSVRQRLRVEEARRHFAESRNSLVELVSDGKIDVNSHTFKYLYGFNTCLMRRPDQYPKLSARLRRIFLTASNPESDNPLLDEVKNWTEEIKNVVTKTAEAMFYLSLIFSWKMRCICWLEKNFKVFTWLKIIIERCIDCLDYLEKNKTDEDFAEEIKLSRESMNRLCHGN